MAVDCHVPCGFLFGDERPVGWQCTVLLRPNRVSFHYTLTNGPSNDFTLAENVPSHSPWHGVAVIKYRGKCTHAHTHCTLRKSSMEWELA